MNITQPRQLTKRDMRRKAEEECGVRRWLGLSVQSAGQRRAPSQAGIKGIFGEAEGRAGAICSYHQSEAEDGFRNLTACIEAETDELASLRPPTWEDQASVRVSLRVLISSSLLLLLFVAELVVNGRAFAIFGESPWVTFGMGSGVIVGILVFAHLIGSRMKQKRSPAITWMLLAIVLCTLVALAVIRGAYLDSAGLLGDVGVALSPFVVSVLLLVLNVFMVALAAFVAYELSPEDPARDKNSRRYRTLNKRIKDDMGKRKKIAVNRLAGCESAKAVYDQRCEYATQVLSRVSPRPLTVEETEHPEFDLTPYLTPLCGSGTGAPGEHTASEVPAPRQAPAEPGVPTVRERAVDSLGVLEALGARSGAESPADVLAEAESAA